MIKGKAILLGCLCLFVVACDVISQETEIKSAIENSDNTHIALIIAESYQDSRRVCEGVILDKFWILTTAKCLGDDARTTRNVTYLEPLNSHKNINTTVEKIIIHPNYRFWSHNLALIKLKTPLSTDSSIKIAEKSQTPPTQGILVSWNRQDIDYENITNTTIEIVKTPLDLTLKHTENRYEWSVALKSVPNGFYLGVSGAPIFNRNTSELIGLYSHTNLVMDSLIDLNEYNYVDLLEYREWIEAEMKG